MSYILDALKKAEQIRRAGPVPTIDTVHGPAPVAPRRRLGPWALGVLAIAGTGVAIALLRPSPRPIPLRSVESKPPSAAPATSAPAALDPGERVRSGAREVTASSPPASARRPAPRAAGPAAVAAAPAPPVPPKVPARPSLSAPAPSSSAVAAEPPPADGPAPSPRLNIHPAPPAEAPVPASRGATPLPLSEMPAAVREALPKLKLDVLVYADSPAGRMVFINGRRYAQGDSLEGKAVVEEITQDGAILRYQGQRFLLR